MFENIRVPLPPRARLCWCIGSSEYSLIAKVLCAGPFEEMVNKIFVYTQHGTKAAFAIYIIKNAPSEHM